MSSSRTFASSNKQGAAVNTRAWITVGLVTGLAWAAAGPTFAEESGATGDVARAEADAADAYDAYSRKDYSAAVALYQKALESAPSADILYNLARIYDTKLKDRGLAIEYYRRYTIDTGADPNRVRVASARLSELRELEAIVGAQATTASGPSAVATTQPAPPGAPSKPVEHGGLSGVQVAGIVTGAIGVASLGLGLGFGLKAKGDADAAERFCDGNVCRTQRGVDESRDAKDAATVSTIAFVAGSALTLLGVTAVLLGSSGTREREVMTTSITPYAAPGSVGALLASRW
jgi:tetratricopeptide (TPR) repeat protein